MYSTPQEQTGCWQSLRVSRPTRCSNRQLADSTVGKIPDNFELPAISVPSLLWPLHSPWTPWWLRSPVIVANKACLLPVLMRSARLCAVLFQPPFLAPVSGLRPFGAASGHGAISRRVFPSLVLSGGGVVFSWGTCCAMEAGLGPFPRAVSALLRWVDQSEAVVC